MNVRVLDQLAMERHIYLEVLADSLGRGQFWGTDLRDAEQDNYDTDRVIREHFSYGREQDLIDLHEYEESDKDALRRRYGI